MTMTGVFWRLDVKTASMSIEGCMPKAHQSSAVFQVGLLFNSGHLWSLNYNAAVYSGVYLELMR
jgi:hypothetical protein